MRAVNTADLDFCSATQTTGTALLSPTPPTWVPIALAYSKQSEIDRHGPGPPTILCLDVMLVIRVGRSRRLRRDPYSRPDH
jgi:hypothetical protein